MFSFLQGADLILVLPSEPKTCASSMPRSAQREDGGPLNSYCISAQDADSQNCQHAPAVANLFSTSVISSLSTEEPASSQHHFHPQSPCYSLPILISLPTLFQCIIITDLHVVFSLDYEILEILVVLTCLESYRVSSKQ